MKQNKNKKVGSINLEVLAILPTIAVYGLAITLFSLGRQFQVVEATGSGLIVLCIIPLLILGKLFEIERSKRRINAIALLITALGVMLAAANLMFAITNILLILSFILLLSIALTKALH
ncbi:MAG: hypothetical protein K5744_09015 [Eubacterium sp.]|nr:hypothetical protein [Eubacterium sp.]